MSEQDKPRRQIAAAITGRRELPQVVASGFGAVAEEILALAFANGVKVREDADLAEILVALDLEENIPLEALQAVSEILARVYAANGRTT